MVKKNNIAFFTVIYNQNAKFTNDFLISLNNQTYKDFDLFIVNDNVKDLLTVIKKYPNLNPIIFNLSGTPTEIRLAGLKKLTKLSYKYIIFGDCDDYFKPNRIEFLCNNFNDEFDLLVHDVSLVDSNSKVIQNNFFYPRINHNQHISINDILTYNFLGLTNTAISHSVLKKLTLVNVNVIALDWYLFSQALLLNIKTKFLKNNLTYYRQHERSLVGYNKNHPQIIETGVKV